MCVTSLRWYAISVLSLSFAKASENSTLSMESSTSSVRSSISATTSSLFLTSHNSNTNNLTRATKNITVIIIVQNNYSSIIGDSNDDILGAIRENITRSLNLPREPNIDIKAKNDSTSLHLFLDVPDFLAANLTESIALRLKTGSMELYGYNGTKLNVPPQANGKLLNSDQKNYTTIIIGVTAASLGATFLLILWIIWNSKNSKAVKPHNALHFNEGLNVFNVQESSEVHHSYQQRKTGEETGLGGLNEARVQWDIFQKSFNKPAYNWKNQDTVWAGVDYKVDWTNDLAVKSNSQEIQEPDRESKRI